jgi:hypothetical protein
LRGGVGLSAVAAETAAQPLKTIEAGGLKQENRLISAHVNGRTGRVGRQEYFGMRAITVDDDRTGADFGEFGPLHQRAAERHGMRRFTAHADDGRGAFPQSEDAEQMHVLIDTARELATEQRGRLVGRDLSVRSGRGQRRAGQGGESVMTQ